MESEVHFFSMHNAALDLFFPPSTINWLQIWCKKCTSRIMPSPHHLHFFLELHLIYFFLLCTHWDFNVQLLQVEFHGTVVSVIATQVRSNPSPLPTVGVRGDAATLEEKGTLKSG